MPRHTAVPGATIATATVAGVTGEIQAVASSLPKDWFAVVTRTAITAPDLTGSSPYALESLPAACTVQAGDGYGFQVYGDCDTPLAMLSFLLVFLDEAGAVMRITTGNAITAVGGYTRGGRYPATLAGTAQAAIPFDGASAVIIAVSGVTAGSWTLSVKVC